MYKNTAYSSFHQNNHQGEKSEDLCIVFCLLLHVYLMSAFLHYVMQL